VLAARTTHDATQSARPSQAASFWFRRVAIGTAQPTDLIDPHLTPGERETFAQLANARRRAEWRAGRLAAKRAAGAVAGIPRLDAIEIRGGGGRLAPQADWRVDGRSGRLTIALSLAHCDGHAVAIASAVHAAVGIDLERAGAVGASQSRYFLTAAERFAARDADATAWWALKEAAWKAAGCGDDVPFTALEVRCDATGGVAGVALHGDWREAGGGVWSPWPGFVAAVVTLAGEAGEAA
jgi:4'-phosphopantetheinyl transferase EntD